METFFLVGFEGSGKKTIANLLASRKNIQYIDIEKLIEQDENTSIYNIENLKGEDYLNKKIFDVLNNIPKADCVVSTSTFTSSNENNRNIMLKKGKVIYLKSNAKTIIEHLKDNYKNNALLKENFDENKIDEMIKNLDDGYVKSSNYTIVTDNKNVHEVFNEVLFYHNVVNMLNCHIHIK